jgi:hypothetical protein
MKIGILIKSYDRLSNWEMRIINKIIKDENLELTLLIKDGREALGNNKSTKNRFLNLIKSKNNLAKFLFKIQTLIEQKIFKENYTIDRDYIINELNSVETIYLQPKSKGFLDIFSSNDAKKIRTYNLDILLYIPHQP